MGDGAAARARGYYYGWPMLAAVALGQVTSYGVLFYGFTVFLGPMGADLGWSRAAMTGAFSRCSSQASPPCRPGGGSTSTARAP